MSSFDINAKTSTDLLHDSEGPTEPGELLSTTTENFHYVNPSWVQAGNSGPLPQYDWVQSTTTTESAGQDGRAEEETSLAQNFHHDHYNPQESDDGLENLGSPAADSLACSDCPATFSRPRDLNKHIKKHTRPYKCAVDLCDRAFELQTGLDRHFEEMHDPNALRYFCPWKDAGCRSKVATEGTKRKENLNRHVKDKHEGKQP